MRKITLLFIPLLAGCSTVKPKTYADGFKEGTRACFTSHERLLKNPTYSKEQILNIITGAQQIYEAR